MRIVYDARTATDQPTGIGKYTLHLIENIVSADPSNSYFCICNDPEILDSRLPDLGSVRFIKVDVSHQSHPWGEIWENRVLPRLLSELKCDIFHGPAYLIPWRTFPGQTYKTVLTVHDLSFIKFRKFFPYRFSFYLKRLLKRTVKSADVIVADSESTKSDLLSYYRIKDKQRVRVIPCGVGGTFGRLSEEDRTSKAAKMRLPKRYLLSVGTIEPRKNYLRLIEVFEQLKIEKNIPHKLIIVGGAGWKASPVLRRINSSIFKKDIILKGYISDEELNVIYNNAEVFVMLSHYEGFGMPVLEAMKCGAPVVAAKNSSFPEIVGDAGCLINLFPVERIKEAILSLLRDPAYRTDLANRGIERASQYTWQSTAKQFLSLYGEIN